MIGGHELSYTLAIVAFLIGTALGVSVARRRIIQLRAAANEPKSGATDVVVSPATVDEIVIAALDSLPSGVVIAGADGTVLFKNTAAKSISGVRHIDVLVDEAVESMVATAVTNEAQHRRFETAGSPSRAFDIRTKRLANGRIVATVEDVTEQSRIDTVRTDFVANLSHELKTPIGGIAALADTMSGETDPAVIERLTARIVDESYRLSRIVDDLLDLSRIEFGGADDWEPVTVTDVVNEVVARMQHEAKRAGVAIDAKCVAGVRVVGDRMQLVSALQNLVSNAIKYSGDGKKVQVEVQATPELVSIIVSPSCCRAPSRRLSRLGLPSRLSSRKVKSSYRASHVSQTAMSTRIDLLQRLMKLTSRYERTSTADRVGCRRRGSVHRCARRRLAARRLRRRGCP
ncbi:MAG: hypothetical protein EBV14_00340 [Actinobacteria bacterium]|nr:hypothetical protein [Actinomycetota bacterium]